MHDKPTLHDHVVTWSNLAVAFFALVAIIFNCIQIVKSDRASKATLNKMDSALYIGNRPFMAFLGVVKCQYEIGKPLYFEGGFKNYGQTPAYINSDYIRCAIIYPNEFTNKIMPTLKGIDSIANRNPFISIVGKEEEMELPEHSDNIISKECDSALNKGITKWYVWGTVNYIDIWGRKHHTHICGTYDKATQAFSTYGWYNDAN